MASSHINVTDFKTQLPGERVPGGWDFPPVVSVNSRGKSLTWKIYVRLFADYAGRRNLDDIPADRFVNPTDEHYDNKVIDANLRGWIKVDSGLTDGKIKTSPATIISEGKNLGKKSATNAWTQALRTAYSMYNKQCEKKRPADVAAIEFYPPMLAQVFSQQKNVVIDEEHPAYVQRKYNGVRVVAVNGPDGVILYSRRKKLYPGLDYIRQEVSQLTALHREVYLDGEIYLHGAALQDISGAARGDRDNNIKYDYMVYDLFIPGQDLDYVARKELLEELFARHQCDHVKPVETFRITSAGEITPLFDRFIEEKYEGAMVRLNTVYQYSYNERHSKYLLKVKPTFDAELEIVGYTVGTRGKADGALMIECAVDGKDARFPVTPAMELLERHALAEKMATVEPNGKTHFENHWLGKKIIVEYDELSTDGIPQRARTRMQIRTWD